MKLETRVSVIPATLMALLEVKYPQVLEVWDRWDYKVLGPLSLDDAPQVVVILKNKNGTQVGLVLPVVSGSTE